MKFETIFQDRYSPKENDIIYHYCNETGFLGICRTQTIWLSDILEMNDSSEYQWGRDKFVEVLKKYKDEFTQDFRLSLIMGIHASDSHVKPCICSFSKKGDLLSQWRAYAQDGEGYSIGFSAKSIFEDLGVNINSVVYSENKQKQLILHTIRGLFATWLKDKDQFRNIAISFGIDLAYFKNPSFFEEQEIRIIRLINDDSNGLTDPGGNSRHGKIAAQPIQKREFQKREIIYLALPIKFSDTSFIKEIIIGPKNSSTIEDVKEKLIELGLTNVSVKKSTSTYR